MFKTYVVKRDELINDKIYPDDTELVLMKSLHNKALKKVFSTAIEEYLYDVSKCDIAVAIAVKSLKEEYNLKFEKQETEFSNKINIQQTEFLEKFGIQQSEFSEKFNKQEETNNELQKQINLLINSKT
ncbi:hypothetical protein [Spiroplasma endosymbiont of Othius punctulatus]|uniref:hypothetical protein n=1 Tax=Spiroplasma endosymbiont of Othius punctulatus TaxID=3066289 RepID=UPI0030CFD4B8